MKISRSEADKFLLVVASIERIDAQIDFGMAFLKRPELWHQPEGRDSRSTVQRHGLVLSCGGNN